MVVIVRSTPIAGSVRKIIDPANTERYKAQGGWEFHTANTYEEAALIPLPLENPVVIEHPKIEQVVMPEQPKDKRKYTKKWQK